MKTLKYRKERFDDHQQHNADKQNRDRLVDDFVKARAMGVLIAGEFTQTARKIPVQCRHQQHQTDFISKPGCRVFRRAITGDDHQPDAKAPGCDHRRVDDGFQQAPLHHLKQAVFVAVFLYPGMVGKQARKIEHPRHPGGHADDMQGFDEGVMFHEIRYGSNGTL